MSRVTSRSATGMCCPLASTPVLSFAADLDYSFLRQFSLALEAPAFLQFAAELILRSLREIDEMRSEGKMGEKGDILVVTGPLVANFQLTEVLQAHAAHKKRDKSTIMTCALKRLSQWHRSRSADDRTIWGALLTCPCNFQWASVNPVTSETLNVSCARGSVHNVAMHS